MPDKQFLQNLYQESTLNKREIDLILCHFLKVNTAGLMIYNQTISDSVKNNILVAIKKRVDGMPLAYITGIKGFWSLNLQVNQHTLIPRPETEHIVELILQWTDNSFSGTILDLGTGTGAIALSIATERPNAQIVAVDFSIECIKVAETNRKRYQLDNVKIIQSNWLSHFSSKDTFDFIISNPPYVSEDDPHLQDLRFEPITALTAKDKGLADIQIIIQQAKKHLKPEAKLILEHGYNQKQAVHQLLLQNNYHAVTTYKDLSKIPRITVAQY